MTTKSVWSIVLILQWGWIRTLFVHLIGCPSAEAILTSKNGVGGELPTRFQSLPAWFKISMGPKMVVAMEL